MKRIKLGYEVKTAKEVSIQPSHLIVTGITQLSGKTTTLESLIKRSGMKAIVFKTKIGEKSFTQGTVIPPFFKDRSDYEFIKSLIEAYAKEKLYLEKGTLMRLCQGAQSLLEIKKRVDDRITGKKMRGIEEEIHTRLQHYLESIIPQIQYANFSKVLSMVPGVNIMDLERFTEEVQSLIIESVATEVLNNQHDIILVIPEAWKFLPQKYNNPCKRAVESFIRQGATNSNYIWIDSMPSYEVILVRIGDEVQVMSFSELFNLPGNVIKRKHHEIKYVKDDIFVLDSNGSKLSWVKLTKVFRHEYKGDILSINTLDGVVDVSPNHPICKYPRYVVEAKDLNVGDAVQTRLMNRKWHIRNNRGLFIGDENLAWLLGFFCAEGWTHGKHICLSNKNKEYLIKAKFVFDSIFHHSASFTNPRKGVYTLDISSPKLVNYFSQCYGDVKHESETKKVPVSVMNAPLKIKEAFLDGYFDGDGSHEKKNNHVIGFTTTSRQLALGVIELMNCVNGRTYVSVHTRVDKLNSIQFNFNKTYNRKDRKLIKKIIRKKYSGFLYDIEVDSKDHSFYMGIGNIRVHNSQDMAGVDKQPLKQVSTWILGYQAERNEVKHTLDQISLPKKLKPKEDDIMTLKLGHFYLSSYDGVKKIYVQPLWVDDATAIKIAKGLMESSDVTSSQSLVPYSVQPKSTSAELSDRLHADSIHKQIPLLRSQLIEMRSDFFNKITELQNYMNQLSSDIMKVRSQQHDVDMNEIVSLVLQKLPVQPNGSPINKEEIILEVLKRVPQSPGAVTYQVAPLEKIAKDFLEESKQFIMSNVSKLDDEQKKMLKYVETQGSGKSLGNIIEKCLFKSQTSGGTRKSVGDKLKEMNNIEVVRYDATHGLYYPALKTVIQKYCGQHSATEQDIQQVYDHIMMTMLK